MPAFDASIRLQKLLASAGFGSRRDVERFLTDERVTVNGRVAKLGDRADPAVDDIRLDGERLGKERPAYWIVNKPRGVVTTVRDDEGRRTVIDLLPPKVGRLFPVGRLDRETSGLLLLTNDGDLAHALLHPSLGNEREYRVNVKGKLDAKAITRLERGVVLEEGKTAGARVDRVRYDADSDTSSLSLTLVEGKKRQIRRSLLVLGFPVRRLVRVRMGPLRIGRLAVGEARPLRAEERRALLEHARRLRAGEAPERSRPPAGPRGGRARTKADAAAPPKPRSTRRTRGSAATGSAARKAGARKTAGRKPAGKSATGRAGSRPARKKSGAKKGPSKAVKKRAARKATSGRSAGPRKSSAKPRKAAGRAQRTASSRKGVRK